jgi:hypothetical protein
VFAPLGAALSGGGQAHADTSEDGFVNQIRVDERGTGTYDQILSNGYASFRILRTTDADTNDVARIAAPRIGLSYSLAIGQVVTAVRWLCPDQMYKVRLDQ